MKSIGIFSSYYPGSDMPAYVRYYLKEVRSYFSDFILVANEKKVAPGDVTFLKENNITLKLVANEGYDFGMYYKMFKEFDLTGYDRVGLINDSCILFKSPEAIFKWMETEHADYYGLTDSNEVKYHLQSYFVIINKRAIPFVVKYFNENGIIHDFWKLVNIYEVGLSTFLLDNGLVLKALYPVDKSRKGNAAYLDAIALIRKGFPMIKRKIFTLASSSIDWKRLVMQGFNPNSTPYITQIKEVTGSRFPTAIFTEFITDKSLSNKIQFTIKYIFFYVFGFLWRMLSKIKGLLIGGN